MTVVTATVYADAAPNNEMTIAMKAFLALAQGRAVKLDTAHHGPHLTLSNGNLQANTTNIDDWSRAQANVARSDGLLYWEVEAHYNAAPYAGGELWVGFATAAFDPLNTTDMPGATGLGEFVYSAGIADPPTGSAAASDGTNTTAVPRWASGEIPCFAVNQTLGMGWVGTVASGFAGDPVAGTGATFTFTPGTPIRPIVVMYSDTAADPITPVSARFNFGAQPFAGAQPAGFGAYQY